MTLRNGTDDVEWLARTAEVQVRVNTLAAGAATPWHFHTEVADDIFCLERELEVALRAPDETARLAPGGRVTVRPGRVHRVLNPAAEPVRYLLVQATGRYDFHVVPAEGATATGGAEPERPPRP